ncbi:response regulator transcription factor [Sulfurimonas sp. HSL-1716]|uniref:response regulator transcription factor n=1 Tax=Hydrocurvibacter sulfurireducens TaxID=3131937 RepID=UPI0031F830D9
MSSILLLEDDVVLSETLVELLEADGFKVIHVQDGEAALEYTFEKQFDILLFDVNVPHLDGFELLKSLRESGYDTPAIFITALTDIVSLSHGFGSGADDYIKKPFDFDELLIRIKALLKKQYHTYSDKIAVGTFYFMISKDELYQNGKFLPLSPYELYITKILFQNIDKTVLKENILNTLGEGREMSEGSLRVYINKLRKIGLPISTVKGIGYRLASS